MNVYVSVTDVDDRHQETIATDVGSVTDAKGLRSLALAVNVTSQWTDGAVIAMTVINASPAPIAGAVVSFTYAGIVEDVWGATLTTDTGSEVVIRLDQTLAPGETEDFKIKVDLPSGVLPKAYCVVPQPDDGNAVTSPDSGVFSLAVDDVAAHPYSEPKPFTASVPEDQGRGPHLLIHPEDDSFERFLTSVDSYLSWGEENTTVLPGSETPSGRRGLQTTVQAHTSSPSDNGQGGTGWEARFMHAQRTILRYRVRFEAGFEWVLGGKLPGLAGGDTPSGGKPTDNGFTMRFMWRENGAGEVYAYIPNKQHTYGDSIGRGLFHFSDQQWTTIHQEIVLNDVLEDGRVVPNGLLRLWIDHQPIFEVDNLIYRTREDITLEQIMYTIFFGGTGEDWRTPRDQVINTCDYALWID